MPMCGGVVVFFLSIIIPHQQKLLVGLLQYIYNIFVSVNEWDGKTDLFNNAVKGVWEGSSWSVSKSEGYVPKTVLLANANSTPDDIRMDAAVKSKVNRN